MKRKSKPKRRPSSPLRDKHGKPIKVKPGVKTDFTGLPEDNPFDSRNYE